MVYVKLVIPLQSGLITIRLSLLENGLRISDVDASGRRYIPVKGVYTILALFKLLVVLILTMYLSICLSLLLSLGA
jgi:hypothetical protein